MKELAFLCLIIAVVSAVIGGWIKQEWPIAAGVILIVISMFLLKAT
jgi:hypothetical protein